MIAALVLGCGARDAEVRAAWEREAARADRRTATDGPADLVWHASGALVDDLLTAAAAELGPVGRAVEVAGATLTPDLRVREVALRDPGALAKPACKACLAAELTLAGDVRVESRALGKATFPLTVSAIAIVRLDVATAKGGFEVRADPIEVRRPVVEVKGLDRRLAELAADPLGDAVTAGLRRFEPVSLGTFGDAALPLVAARVLPEGLGVRVELVSDAPDRAAVDASGDPPERGFRLDADARTVVALARREAFRRGPDREHGLAVVPAALRGDDPALREGRSLPPSPAFALELRVWKLASGSWWRDYRATGRAEVARGSRLQLRVDAVESLGESPGADLADPLAALADGLLLDRLADALHGAVPATLGVGGREVALREVRGQGDRLVLLGDVRER